MIVDSENENITNMSTKIKSPLVIYTNPITGNMVVGLPGGPPLKKFKKGQEAEAKAWAECVPGWSISLTPRSQKYGIYFTPHNGATPQQHPERRTQEEAIAYVRGVDKSAIIALS